MRFASFPSLGVRSLAGAWSKGSFLMPQAGHRSGVQRPGFTALLTHSLLMTLGKSLTDALSRESVFYASVLSQHLAQVPAQRGPRVLCMNE